MVFGLAVDPSKKKVSGFDTIFPGCVRMRAMNLKNMLSLAHQGFVGRASSRLGLRLPSRRKSIGGFTLLELMAVVTIIALLASMAMPMLSEYNRRARGSRSSTNLKQLQSAMDSWEIEAGAPLDPFSGDRAEGETGIFEIDPVKCNDAYSNQSGGGGGNYFAEAVGRYIKVNNTLWNSPQSRDYTDPTYRYKVFAVVDSSDGMEVEILSSAVWSILNGDSKWEPRLSKQQRASGIAQALYINGYEDQGRLGPTGEPLGSNLKN
jgi:prepilin-type N-terminal cleavage/methylation domain-containing protein